MLSAPVRPIFKAHDFSSLSLFLGIFPSSFASELEFFVLEEGQEGPQTRRSLVQVLAVEPERALVSGLEGGERVVASGAHRLVAGQRVEPLP
mgnify:CR=1 FL=1